MPTRTTTTARRGSWKSKPRHTIGKILLWADAHYRRTGNWPRGASGRVFDCPTENWEAIDSALGIGCRGLPGGMTLARLLAEHRGARTIKGVRLATDQIVRWADAHHRRTGKWPTVRSGPITGAPGETWHGIDSALYFGFRGLEGESSLARLLAKRRGVRNDKALPPLQIAQILRWADAYHRRTGNWPSPRSGPIAGSGGESWGTIQRAFQAGRRGLRRGTLSRLLVKYRNVHKGARPRLTIRWILRWADAHHARTGVWPNASSGPIVDADGETWSAVSQALRNGLRGLKENGSISRLLVAQGRKAARWQRH